MLRHCLDCNALVVNDTRCRRCQRIRNIARMRVIAERRGRQWKKVSEQLRQRWRDQGYGCAHAHLGGCRGRIQADHVNNTGAYQPLCAYHNNLKH